MRAVRTLGLLLVVLAVPSLALAQTPEPTPPEPTPEPAPVPAPSSPPAPPGAGDAAPLSPVPAAPTPVEPPAAPVEPPAAPARPSDATPLTPAPAPLAVPAPSAPPLLESSFTRDFDALPLTLEARFGFNARLSSSFGPAAQEELVDTTVAVGGYLAWNPEYALGLELEHSGLGRVRGLSGQDSIDAEYSATSGWLAARVFPIRRERLDLFINLRIGLALQHVDARGTRLTSASITVPAASFSCTESDGPGLGLGGAVGVAYRLARHVSFFTRVDATGERLSGDPLGTCADGIGSVATISGALGLAYELDTAPR